MRCGALLNNCFLLFPIIIMLVLTLADEYNVELERAYWNRDYEEPMRIDDSSENEVEGISSRIFTLMQNLYRSNERGAGKIGQKDVLKIIYNKIKRIGRNLPKSPTK